MYLMPVRSALSSIILTFPFAIATVTAVEASPDYSIAQAIAPANDGTNTQINQTADQFVIDGGTQTETNLFHSFQQFGLATGQTATFLSTPDIQTILGRVRGGNASVIDGLLQVAGSDADLYLVNPAGILFGENARLDLSGSFTATTADGLRFGPDWFDVLGNNDYASFTAPPTGFAFSLAEPGSIVNQGELAAVSGQRIVLLGGSVINTGTVSTPGGDIYLSAVPGENMVTLTQAGQLVSFDLPVETEDQLSATGQAFSPVALPQLLTGGSSQEATELLIEGEQLQLTGSGSVLVTQRVDVSHPEANGGNIQVVGDRIGIINAELAASGTDGGTIRIGGSDRGQGPLPNAGRLYVSEGSSIAANAGQLGEGGRIVLWADNQNLTYGSLSAQGGLEAGNGGFIEVSSRDYLAFRGQADTQAPNGDNGILLIDPVNIVIRNGTADGDDLGDLNNLLGTASDTDVTVAAEDAQPTIIYESELEGLSENNNILLEATNDITIEDLDDDLLAFQGNSGQTVSFLADADRDGVGQFSMDSNDTIQTQGARLEITAAELSLGNLQIVNFVRSPEDAGQTIDTASNASSSIESDIDSIEGVLSDDNDVDLYRIFIRDTEDFSITASSDDGVDTQLFLFDEDSGIGVYASDNSTRPFSSFVSPNPRLELSDGQTIEAGFYYLGISSSDNDPISTSGEIFPDEPTFEVNEPLPATANLSLSGWNNQGSESGEYQLRLAGISGSGADIYETPRSSLEVIRLEANSGDVQLQSIDTRDSIGAGVTIEAAGNVTATGDIDTLGGDVNITGSSLALAEIDTDLVDEAFASDESVIIERLSQAGNVILVSTESNIIIDSISAEGEQIGGDSVGYRGGDVQIASQGIFRATGTIGQSVVSIDTSGFEEVGNVTIQAESLDGQFVSGVSREETVSEFGDVEIVFKPIPGFSFLEGQSGLAGIILSDTGNQSYISSYTDSGIFSGNEFDGEFEVPLNESNTVGNIDLTGISVLSEVPTAPVPPGGSGPTVPNNPVISNPMVPPTSPVEPSEPSESVDPNSSSSLIATDAAVENLDSTDSCSTVLDEDGSSSQCTVSEATQPIGQTILEIDESLLQE